MKRKIILRSLLIFATLTAIALILQKDHIDTDPSSQSLTLSTYVNSIFDGFEKTYFTITLKDIPPTMPKSSPVSNLDPVSNGIRCSIPGGYSNNPYPYRYLPQDCGDELRCTYRQTPNHMRYVPPIIPLRYIHLSGPCGDIREYFTINILSTSIYLLLTAFIVWLVVKYMRQKILQPTP